MMQTNYYWTAAGDICQNQWNKILHLTSNDEFVLQVWGALFIAYSTYWSVALLYAFIDLTGKPAFLLRYKTQDAKKNPVEISKFFHVVKQVLFNQIVITIPCAIAYHYLRKWRGYDNGNDLPTFKRVLIEILLFVVIEEIGFYYTHRLLHHPKLYRRIHKQHHEFISPFAIVSMYCHPIEHIFSNLMPLFIGPFLLGSHIAVMWIWSFLAILSTLIQHSGYHFPFFPSNEAHDFHHLKFNENFGLCFTLNLDTLHGTDNQFRRTKEYARHRTFFSLFSLKELDQKFQNKN